MTSPYWILIRLLSYSVFTCSLFAFPFVLRGTRIISSLALDYIALSFLRPPALFHISPSSTFFFSLYRQPSPSHIPHSLLSSASGIHIVHFLPVTSPHSMQLKLSKNHTDSFIHGECVWRCSNRFTPAVEYISWIFNSHSNQPAGRPNVWIYCLI